MIFFVFLIDEIKLLNKLLLIIDVLLIINKFLFKGLNMFFLNLLVEGLYCSNLWIVVVLDFLKFFLIFVVVFFVGVVILKFLFG